MICCLWYYGVLCTKVNAPEVCTQAEVPDDSCKPENSCKSGDSRRWSGRRRPHYSACHNPIAARA